MGNHDGQPAAQFVSHYTRLGAGELLTDNLLSRFIGPGPTTNERAAASGARAETRRPGDCPIPQNATAAQTGPGPIKGSPPADEGGGCPKDGGGYRNRPFPSSLAAYRLLQTTYRKLPPWMAKPLLHPLAGILANREHDSPSESAPLSPGVDLPGTEGALEGRRGAPGEESERNR